MKNTYIFMFIQALLTLLLFFSEGYVRYATIALFVLFDLVLFFDLLTKRWAAVEIMTFAAILCSGMFLLFYVFMKSLTTTVFGVALVLLFLVIAMIDLLTVPRRSRDKIEMPKSPEFHYDVEYGFDYDRPAASAKPEPVMHVKKSRTHSDVKDKLAAKAVAYELEKEASEMKKAESMIKDLKVYNAEKELLKESMAMENAQRQMDQMAAAKKTMKAAKELKKEAAEIKKVQKQITQIQKIKDIEREAKSLNKAQKQIQEVEFLNQQEKIVKQAKAIAKAQKDIDELKTKKPKVETVKVKTVKVPEESFYFSTENGNKFHEPGCLAIKKVPKNKLTLYTSKKEAMKKGLQPCNVCIPK